MAPLHIRHGPAHVLMVVLGSAFGEVALACFLVFHLPPLPIQGNRGLSSIVFFFFFSFSFSIELTVQSEGCFVLGLRGGRGLLLGCG